MARFDPTPGLEGTSVRSPASHYKDVTEFRGMDLDTLAKQYALYRQLNALDVKPPSPSPSDAVATAAIEPAPGLMNRLFGRFAAF